MGRNKAEDPPVKVLLSLNASAIAKLEDIIKVRYRGVKKSVAVKWMIEDMWKMIGKGEEK